MAGIDKNFPFNQDEPLLQIEQRLLDEGMTEDDLNRLYPDVINNGRCPYYNMGCLCPQCDPWDYASYAADKTPGVVETRQKPVQAEKRPVVEIDLLELDDHPF